MRSIIDRMAIEIRGWQYQAHFALLERIRSREPLKSVTEIGFLVTS